MNLRSLPILLMGIPSLVPAQECGTGRYTDPLFFAEVNVTQAVTFGSNTGVGGGNQTLRMDVYEPVGDLLDERPVVLVAFGGSFITGTRADVANICQAFARMGYVAVAPDYRVGFFFPNQVSTTRAVMRGSHDMKACVRYLRRTVVEDGNPYGIDQDRIIVGGVSAGAISAVHCAYLDEEAEIPEILVPEAPSLGGVEGNSGSPGYSSDVFAVYSFSGAIGDTTWIVPGDQPMASVHEVGDGVVPYYTQEVSVIGIPTGLVASGSHDIHVRLDNIATPNCFLSYPGNGHVGYIGSDFANSVGFVAQFLSDLICDQPLACTMATGSEDLVQGSVVLPYPNPTTGPVQLDLPVGSIATVFAADGRMILSRTATTGTLHFDLAGLPSGIYQIRVQGDMEQSFRVMKVD